jgi:hypothetical protein
MNLSKPTQIFRLIHIDNLIMCFHHGGFHAPNHIQDDGMSYKTIHNIDIQEVRSQKSIPCGPGGTVHDYVSFYFGPRSPMLLQLHTGQVAGYNEGQEPLIYIVSTVEEVIQNKLEFSFSDGHGIATFTKWFDDIQDLDKVDWDAVNAKIWKDTLNDMDRQRRKQAEFLVYQFSPLVVVTEIGVLNHSLKQKVETILNNFNLKTIPVNIHVEWYY